MRDYRAMLEMLGLAVGDQALYEAMLADAQVADLAEVTRLSVREPSIGDPGEALARLEARGLVRRLAGQVPQWTVCSPRRELHGLILSRELALALARYRVHELAMQFRQADGNSAARELVEVVYGQEACLRRFEQLHSNVRHDLRSMTAPPFFDGPGSCGNPRFDLISQGGRYRVIYAETTAETPGWLQFLRDGEPHGEESRVGHTPVKLHLYDHESAMLPLHSTPGIGLSCRIVVRHPALVRALDALFDLCWDRAVPVHVRDGRPEISDPVDPLTATERDLLRLLAAGLTDADIAAHLDWHIVTVRRRIRVLMDKLGASTRFQAGYEAVMRGWLTDRDAPRATGTEAGVPA